MQALDWEHPDDIGNPQNWSRWKRIYNTLIPSAIAFVCTISSSIITPAVDDLQRDLGVSREVSLLPYVLFVLGLSCGPLLAAPCSENFGRRPVYLAGTVVFALFTLGAGFSSGIASLTVCRFLAGVFGSPGLTIGGATISDIWRAEERAIPYAVFVTTPFLGPAIGPLVGGYVTVGKGWRWTQWTILFITSAVLLSQLATSETYKPIILRRRARKAGTLQAEEQRTTRQAVHAFATKILVRPLDMVFLEPVVGFFTLYIALNFGMVYAFFAAFPQVFNQYYGFGIRATGLTFLGLGIGCLVGCAISIIFSRVRSRQRAARARELGHALSVAPEERLYLAMFGSVCLPLGLFWFGWSVQSKVHWICPVIAEGVFGCGNLVLFMAASLYLNQFYGPLYAASANAAASFARYALGAVFPLFIVQMYEALGVGWATSLLGFVSLALLPIPWVLFKTGPRLRRKSRYVSSEKS